MDTLTLSAWSLAIVPALLALYYVQFRLKTPAKDYPVPKCAGSYLCLCTAVAGLGLSGALLREPAFWFFLLCMAGDFLIEKNFMAGGLAFSAGHCCLIAWSLGQASRPLCSLLIWAAAMGVTFWCFRREFPSMGKLTLPFIVYVALLTGDFAATAPLPFAAGTAYWPLPVGLLLFVCSDILLGKKQFTEVKPRQQEVLMILYYGALYLTAASMWLI